MANAKGPVLFFDADCILCNRSVMFILKNSSNSSLLFATLQSAPGQKAVSAIQQHYKKPPDSLILWHNGRYFEQADAVIRTAILMGGIWRMAAIFKIFPIFLLNPVYSLISRYRYALWGKQIACLLPNGPWASRFYK